MKKLTLALALLVSLCGLGCTLGPAPVGGHPEWTCAPGEELDAHHCQFSCPDGTTHSICADDGHTSRCALRDGVDQSVCEDVPPTPCAGDDRAGTACGCGNTGIWACDASTNTLSCVGADAVEICGNGVDDDCDGRVDEDCMSGCTPVTEICDNVDNDCDGERDEGCDDDDGFVGDDYCDASMQVGAAGSDACPNSPPGRPGNDCDDTNGRINPGATEVCNGYDDDCDSLIDAADGIICTAPCGTGRLLGEQICVEWTGSTSPMTTYGGATIMSPDVMIFGCDGARSIASGSSDCVPLTEACNGWLSTTASQGIFDDVNNLASFYRPSGTSLLGLNAGDVSVRVWYVRDGVRHDLPGNKSWIVNDPNRDRSDTSRPVRVPAEARSHAGERLLHLLVPVREDCLAEGSRPPDLYSSF